MGLLDWLGEQGHKIRYGIGSAAKDTFARSEPVKRKAKTSEQADRYAAGHKFAKQWPGLAAVGGQAAADRIHFGPVEQMRRGLKLVPGLGDLVVDEDTPELQSFASQGGADAMSEMAAEAARYRKTADFKREADAAAKKVLRKPASRY